MTTSFIEMQALAGDVGDLKKVMSGVKTRGIYGEIRLGAIMEELLRCADVIHSTDVRMLRIREHIEAATDTPSEEDLLLEKISRLDLSLK